MRIRFLIIFIGTLIISSTSLPLMKQQLFAADRLTYREKVEAIEQAGAVGGDEGTQILIGFLRDIDLRIRTRAVSELVSLGDSSLPMLIRFIGDEEVRWLVGGALINIGKPSIKYLVLALKDENPAVRRNALFVLRQLDAFEAAPSIQHCLEDPDLSVRVQAVYTVAKLGGEGALRLIISRFNSSDEEVRNASIESMSFFGEEAIPHLVNVLDRESSRGKISAIKSLGLIGSKRSVVYIEKALKDRDPAVRYQSCTTLGELGDTSAVKRLIYCFTDSVSSVREAANEAVAKLIDKENPLLLKLFKEGSDLEKINGASVVRKARLDNYGTVMAQMLRDPTKEVRIAAVSALIELEDPQTIEPLINSLLDDDVRWFSIIALRRFGQKNLKLLLRRTDDAELNYWKQYVLEGMGEDAIKGCLKGLKEEDLGIKISSICTLKQIKSTRAVYPLINLLGDDRLGDLVSHVIADMGELAVEPLLVSLNDENPHVRARAASALGIVGIQRVVNPLKDLLDDSDPEVRRSAERAIERIYRATPSEIKEKVDGTGEKGKK